MAELQEVTIYTDGACQPNPGVGGYAGIISIDKKEKLIKGGFRKTTNNRMEIYAAIKALESLRRPSHVIIYSDSRYLVDTIQKGWAKRWKAKNWWRTDTDRVANHDLWIKMLELIEKHDVTLKWVKGHKGNLQNELCNTTAKEESKLLDLPPDIEYEKLIRCSRPSIAKGIMPSQKSNTKQNEVNPISKDEILFSRLSIQAKEEIQKVLKDNPDYWRGLIQKNIRQVVEAEFNDFLQSRL